MQQRKIVEDYLNNVIPDKISDSTKAELRAEIESHIYDKAEFYMEIGYDEETAVQKAVEEMGEAEPVREEFESIYKDSTLKGILLFSGMCTLNLLSVSIFELGYWYFVESSMHRLPSLVELSVFLAIFIFLTVYTVKCCRHKLHKQLSGITAAYALIALGSVITSGLFYPVINAGYLVYCYITNDSSPERDIAFPINILVLFLYAFFSFMSLNKDYRFRTKPYRLSLKQITVILSVIGVCFVAVYGFAYEKYERWYPYDNKEEWYAEAPTETYLSNITAEQNKIYASIKMGADAKETEDKLIKEGFVKQKKKYEKFIYDNYMLPYWIENYLYEKNPEAKKGSDYGIYCYTNGMEYEDYYDDIISCIVVSYNTNNEIIHKLYIPDIECYILNGSYQNYHHGEEAQKWFDSLSKGVNCKKALEFIRTTDSYIIEEEKYEDGKTLNSYYIEFRCHYPLDTDFIDFLFGQGPDTKGYHYVFEIKAENGAITDFESRED